MLFSEVLSMASHTQARPEAVIRTLDNRQFALLLFVLIGVLTMVSTLAYTIGRRIPVGSSSKWSEVHVPLPLVVEPARAVVRTEIPEVRPAAVPVQPAPVTATVAAPSAAVQAPSRPPRGELRGAFLQVGSLEKGMAEACKEYLGKHGMSAVIQPSSNDPFYRVLVGPLPTPEALAQTKAELTAMGFRMYLRRF
jgi:cell division septation protein DedD